MASVTMSTAAYKNTDLALETLAVICVNLEDPCPDNQMHELSLGVYDFIHYLKRCNFVEILFLNPMYLKSVAQGVTRFSYDEDFVKCADIISDIVLIMSRVDDTLESFRHTDLSGMANSFSRLCKKNGCPCKEAILVLAKVIKKREVELETCTHKALSLLANVFTKCNHSGHGNVWFKEALVSIAKAVITKEDEDWSTCSHRCLALLAFSFTKHCEQSNEDILKKAVKIIALRVNILFEVNNIPDYKVLCYYVSSFLPWFKKVGNDIHFKEILRFILMTISTKMFKLLDCSEITSMEYVGQVSTICSKLRYEDDEDRSLWNNVIFISNIVIQYITHDVDVISRQTFLSTLICLFSKWWDEDDEKRTIQTANRKLIQIILNKLMNSLVLCNPHFLLFLINTFTIWEKNDEENFFRKATIRIARAVMHMNSQPNSNLKYYKLDDWAHICKGFSVWRDNRRCSLKKAIKSIALTLSKKENSYFQNCEISSFVLLLESFTKLNTERFKLYFRNGLVTIATVLLRSYRNRLQYCKPSTLYTLTFCFTSYKPQSEDVDKLRSIIGAVGVAIRVIYQYNNLIEFTPQQLVGLCVLFDKWHPGDFENDSVRNAIETIAKYVAEDFERNELQNYSTEDLFKLATVYKNWLKDVDEEYVIVSFTIIARIVVLYDHRNQLSDFNPKDIINVVSIFSKWPNVHIVFKACLCFAKYIVLNQKILQRYYKDDLMILKKSLSVVLEHKCLFSPDARNILTTAIDYVGDRIKRC